MANTDPKHTILSRLRRKDAVLGIVGMGYVGLPLAIRFAAVGYRVIGFDIDQSKVDALRRGRSYIEHIPNSQVAGAELDATADFSRISDVDAVILCVPTPLNRYREPDLSFVSRSCDMLAQHLRNAQVVSLESTTYPGTTEEEVLPRLERADFLAGRDFFLVYSPEREDPGNLSFTTSSIPKVVAGHTRHCLEVGLALYENAIDRVVAVSSTRTAEMTKLLENIQRAVNIGLVNEMKIVADRMGIDIFEVVDAAATKPFGFTAYYPGPGLGGHCIPIDPFYLTWKAREYDVHTRFIELAGEINRGMPEYVLGKLITGLNRTRKALNGSRVLVLGIAYKKNVGDMRESPSVELMELIKAKGGEVAYSDPHVQVFPRMREHSFELTSVSLSPEVVEGFDAVVLATDHDGFDYDMIRAHASLIVDSRGVYRHSAPHIVKA